MPGGRPTKYTPELLEKAEAYITDFYHHNAQFPSHVGLALYLDVGARTLYDWADQEDKQAFSRILEKITAIQHEMLIGNGITGDFNSNIAKLVLGKHGYHDKGELTGKDGGPIEGKWTVEFVNASSESQSKA